MSHKIQCGPIHWPELVYCDLHTRMFHGTLVSSPFISQRGQGWHMHQSSAHPLFVHKSPSAPLYLHGHSNMILVLVAAVCVQARCLFGFQSVVYIANGSSSFLLTFGFVLSCKTRRVCSTCCSSVNCKCPTSVKSSLVFSSIFFITSTLVDNTSCFSNIFHNVANCFVSSLRSCSVSCFFDHS